MLITTCKVNQILLNCYIKFLTLPIKKLQLTRGRKKQSQLTDSFWQMSQQISPVYL